MRPKGLAGDRERRQEFSEKTRFLAERFGHLGPECPWPARLVQLEAGRPVIVAGWQVGRAQDSGFYCLEADGSLVPVAPVYVDPDADPKTVANYRRPDGSLVRADQ
jgi:hypothetical protein